MEVLRLLTRVKEKPTVDVRIHAIVLLDTFFKTFSKIMSSYTIVITVLFVITILEKVTSHVPWQWWCTVGVASVVCHEANDDGPRCRATQNRFLGFIWNPYWQDWFQFRRSFCLNSFLAVHYQKQKRLMWWEDPSGCSARSLVSSTKSIKFGLVLYTKFAEQAWISRKSAQWCFTA
jgi:hypothetical protein